jgi:hypothetical protein
MLFLLVKFQVMTATTMKMTVFWDVVIIVLMMDVVSVSETSVNFNQTTQRNIPEDSSSLIILINLYVLCLFQLLDLLSFIKYVLSCSILAVVRLKSVMHCLFL